ncbi:hypothetical protein [Dokdonella fugitiva]|jgi:hypothetical protein|uniref:NnrU protein n=1 Tax=Dokdonella fugitiva TaxID=328517 RepID=A0A4R2I0T1_9GAMM|nr:hypothetical protein [Dokdonella fugitiva]MBA8883092.1 hypothetical protein [Dokdonella fugitiva]TCO36518.1 hypothetical protein EV148_1122 [Dokdonella fugitiva]
MFKIIGIFVLLYVAHAVATGRVLAKSGIRMREVLREESPRYYWTVVVIYAALSLALFTVF